MTAPRHVFFALLALLFTGISAAEASPVTWSFAGTMLNGDPFSGWFVFESTTPDQSASTPLRGDYSNAGLDWQFNVGGVLISPITTPGWSGNFEIFDDIQTNEFPFILGDHFRIYADAAPTLYLSAIVAGIDLFFEDASGALVSTDTLPANPPDLSLVNGEPGGWADYLGLQEATNGAEFRLIGVRGGPLAVGRITSVAVPEPSALILLGAGGLGLLLKFRHRRTPAA